MFNIDDKKRIIVKVGTSTITHKTGRINLRRTEKFVRVLSDIHNSGREIILVSSGAIGLGMGAGMYELSILATIVLLICLEALNYYTIHLGEKEYNIVVCTDDQ